MSIGFQWIDHPEYSAAKQGGIARYKIGNNYHQIKIASMDAAMKLHGLLQIAFEAGVKTGDAHGSAYEMQRAADLLGGKVSS